MKVLKHKNLMGLIFTALLSLPLLGIGVRCGYVIANKNAYQSYSGNEVVLHQTTYLNSSIEYRYEYTGITTGETNNTTIIIPLYSIDREVPEGTTSIRFTNGGNMTCLNSSNTSIGTISNADGTQFKVDTSSAITLQSQPWYKIYSIDYKPTDLDNVFEYSVSQFTSENNLGNVNLFSWFTNMFLSDNAHNNLYVGFANWYMNYAMLVACMHLLFLVLMWFINFARRLLERGMNYDF